VLSRIADFLVRAESVRQKIISAMIYPIILTAVAALSVILVLTLVLPQFEPLFQEAGARLPASTQLVMSLGQLLRDDWWILLSAFALVIIGLRLLLQRPAVARERDRLVLRLPVAGQLVVKYEIGRFCRTLAVLLANGVPAPRALALCGATVNNLVLAGTLDAVATRFKEGAGLSAPLSRSPHFPGLATQLIRIGEETGRLEDMLQEVAEIYDQDVQRTIERLLALLVPAITIGMGMIIALIIAAVMTALVSLNDLAV
jgi:general secretion pathway protein F